MKPSFSHKYWVLIMSLCCLAVACQRVQSSGESINKADLETETAHFDEVYHRVLKPRCADGPCHGGSFEPSFTSISSAYYTLVYHPPIKNDLSQTYRYRVLPYSIDSSLLMTRIQECCFNDTMDQMPLLMTPLNSQEIDIIGSWITNGAQDWNGQTPSLPNE
ncbi:MAG TPA: hypothetical protein DCF84_05670 [Bacteroidetes bacterium]|nr:hypothetical protein [Bacteroidota bacterium]|tara:strand:+ start:1569 stop:2054 length:486 start_codon:yes stop_codon:yes gene_type:complete